MAATQALKLLETSGKLIFLEPALGKKSILPLNSHLLREFITAPVFAEQEQLRE
jgi:hypothetical protein